MTSVEIIDRLRALREYAVQGRHAGLNLKDAQALSMAIEVLERLEGMLPREKQCQSAER